MRRWVVRAGGQYVSVSWTRDFLCGTIPLNPVASSGTFVGAVVLTQPKYRNTLRGVWSQTSPMRSSLGTPIRILNDMQSRFGAQREPLASGKVTTSLQGA